MRKRLGGTPPRAGSTGAEEEEQAVARAIGRLQKRDRELELARLKKAPPRKFKDYGPPRVLFRGGAKESHPEEKHDDAFTAANLMRSREVRENEFGEVERYKRGPKKGHPKFVHEGSLAARNEKTLRAYRNKTIRIKVKFDHVREGGLYRKTRFTTRTFAYTDYKGLVDAYTDAMRTVIAKDSSDGFEVEEVTFEEIRDTQPKRRAKRRRGSGRARPKKKRKRAKGKRKGKSRKKARNAADDLPPF